MTLATTLSETVFFSCFKKLKMILLKYTSNTKRPSLFTWQIIKKKTCFNFIPGAPVPNAIFNQTWLSNIILYHNTSFKSSKLEKVRQRNFRKIGATVKIMSSLGKNIVERFCYCHWDGAAAVRRVAWIIHAVTAPVGIPKVPSVQQLKAC